MNGWETHLARYAFAGWGAAEPDASWTFVNSLPEGNYRRGLMWGWFEGMAAADPSRALREGMRLDPKADGFILETLAAAVPDHDPAALRAWLEGLSERQLSRSETSVEVPGDLKSEKSGADGDANGEIGRTLFSRMLEQQLVMGWSSEYVTGLTAWYDQFHGSAVVPDNAMSEISQALSKHRPAPEVWNGLAVIPIPRQPASRIVSGWTTEANADDVAGWLDAHRESAAYDGAAAAFSRKIKSFDPEGAGAWANTVKDRAARESILLYVNHEP